MVTSMPLRSALARRCPPGLADGMLDEIIGVVEAVFCLAPPRSRTYIGGSLGRGEPCIRKGRDSRGVLVSDIDIQVVVADPPPSGALFAIDCGAVLDVHVMTPTVFPRMGLLCSDCIEIVDPETVRVMDQESSPGDAAELLASSAVELMAILLPRCMNPSIEVAEGVERAIHRGVMYNLRAAKMTAGYATFLSAWPGRDEPDVSVRNVSWRCGNDASVAITDLWDSYSLARARMGPPRLAWRDSLSRRRRTPATSFAQWVGEMAIVAMDVLAEARPALLSKSIMTEAWRVANDRVELRVEQPAEHFFRDRSSAFKQALYDHKAFGAQF